MVGATVGILSLTKGVFLPLIVVVPLVLLFRRSGMSLRRMVFIPLIATLVVIPWSVRNFAISRGIVPVHTGMYFNLKVGNIFSDRWVEHPFSYNTIWYEHVVPVIREVSARVEPGPSGDLHKERIYKSMVLDDFSSDIWLGLKKISVAGAMFWTAGDTPLKSLLNTVTRLPILILAIIGVRRELRRNFAAKAALILVGVYWVCHLPVGPPARLSTPVLPILTVWAAAGLLSARNAIRRLIHGLRQCKTGRGEAMV
jgi:hypothetical protein